MPKTVTFAVDVFGIPAPQGSKRHVGNGIMVESSKSVRPWREAVKTAVLDAPDRLEESLDGRVTVEVNFYLPRPKGHWRTGRRSGELKDSAPEQPVTKPDVDKLIRSTLDALKEAGVYYDDSQVVGIGSNKLYATSTRPVGASIVVRGELLTQEGGER